MPSEDRRPSDSALIVGVPEAEPVVSRFRARYDPSAADGVPAHITVLFPFLASESIGTEELGVLGELFGGFDAFDATLARLERRDDVIWLRPQPEDRFRALTAAVWARWTDHPPYEGRFDDVIPHLTIAEGEIDSIPTDVDDAVRAGLPIRTRVGSVDLITFDRRWATTRRFPLG